MYWRLDARVGDTGLRLNASFGSQSNPPIELLEKIMNVFPSYHFWSKFGDIFRHGDRLKFCKNINTAIRLS